MNTTINHQQQKKKIYEDGGGGKDEVQKKQQLPASPPSSTTSPSHEFSFTISLHSSSNEKTLTNTKSKSKTPTTTAATSPHNNNSFAIDLSPADDIFFHGHLLPLHLLSHLPVSPRSSTNSLDSFTLPIKELGDDDNKKPTTTTTNTNTNTSISTNNNGAYSMSSNNIYNNITRENNGRIKAKSFSFLKFPRWPNESEEKEKEREKQKKRKKGGGLNMIQIIKRYAKMVRPLLFYKNNGGKSSAKRETAAGHFDFERETYSSFSGNLSLRGGSNNNKKESRGGGRREFSAPASMWTSPTNSGLLLTTPLGVHSSSSESSMEELQSAIQAAIAHCKNSSTAIKEQEIKLQC